MTTVSVIVPMFNGIEHLPAFFDSLAAALPDGAQVIVVDDASSQPVLDAVPELPRAADVRLLRNDRNVGIGGALNQGFAVATGEVIVQLNNDLVLDSRCVTAMVDLIVDSDVQVGIVGSKLVYPTTGRTQSVGMAFGHHSKRHVFRHLPEDHPLCCRTREAQIVTGATAALTRRVLDRIGPLEEQLYNHNLDLDHCLRAVEHGLRNYLCAGSIAYHWRNRSGRIRYARVEAAEAAFWGKWSGRYDIDLGRFIDEALDHVLNVQPDLSDAPFAIIDLTRSDDQLIALGRLAARWSGIGRSVHTFRQMANGATSLLLPLLLPHWLSQDTTPFIYLVDSHLELEDNAMWFAWRRNVVAQELIVDLSGSVCTTAEFCGWETTNARAAQYST